MFGAIKRTSVCGLLFAGLGIALLAPASAFNISAKGRVHERLSRLAELCLEAGQQAKCPLPADQRAFEKVDWKKGKYWRAVRWPDDPTDQARSVSVVKFAINAGLGRCEKYVGTGKPFGGLMCNSHYGNFQFMHTMKSSADETTEVTKVTIGAWTLFAYRVANGRIDLEANYCDTIRAQGPSLSAALAPPDFPFCEDRQDNGKSFKAWSVRTLFTFKCRNPVSSAVCKETVGEAGRAQARLAATGALLHLIQDSFSSSHTGRSVINPTGPYSAIVDCAAVHAFYFYTANKKNHPAADKKPRFKENCGTKAPVLDPVTASAQMLGLIEHSAEGDEAAAVELVMYSVLG